MGPSHFFHIGAVVFACCVVTISTDCCSSGYYPANNMLLGYLSKLGTESLGTYRSCLPFLHRKTVIVNLGSIRPLFHRNLFFDFPTGSQWVSLD